VPSIPMIKASMPRSKTTRSLLRRFEAAMFCPAPAIGLSAVYCFCI
jgi:hypothetical protein